MATNMAPEVFGLQDDALRVLILPCATKVFQLANQDPPEPPLPEMVVHLRGGHPLTTELENQLGSSPQVHILKPFVNVHTSLDDFDHLVQQEGRQEGSPLHGCPRLVLPAPVSAGV